MDRLTRSSVRSGVPDAMIRTRVRTLDATAVGGTTHRHHAPARCSGGEEARALPFHQRGAQRASSSRPMRLTVMSLALALVAIGGLAANPTPAAAAGIKVVVIVGPAGSSTAKYITSARRYASGILPARDRLFSSIRSASLPRS